MFGNLLNGKMVVGEVLLNIFGGLRTCKAGFELVRLDSQEGPNSFVSLPLKIVACTRLGYSPDDCCLMFGNQEVSGQMCLQDLQPLSETVTMVMAFDGLPQPMHRYLSFDSEKHRKEVEAAQAR